MKRLLILAYDFPPYVSVGGLRPYAWAKYLYEFGVYPIVVTRQWSNTYGDERDYVAPSATNEMIYEESPEGAILRMPYKPNMANRIFLKYGNSRFSLLRRLVSAYYEITQFFFFVGPKSCVYRGAVHYLQNNYVDAIIATGEPFVLFKYASFLSKKYNIPWVADYRDPWKGSCKFLEQYFVRSATSLTTVNAFFAKTIGQLVNRSFEVVMNGYNEELTSKYSNEEQPSNGVLRFAYVGTIYKYHPLESVLSVFNDFASNNNSQPIELNFYGINAKTRIKKIIAEKYPKIQDVVHVYPRMSNAEILQHLSQHHVMLLFNYYYNIGTKIYDYMAMHRRIVLCYSHDVEADQLRKKYYPESVIPGMKDTIQADMIIETNSGIVAQDKQHLLQIMQSISKEFSKTGFVACNSSGYEQYSRRKQTEKLANLVEELTLSN